MKIGYIKKPKKDSNRPGKKQRRDLWSMIKLLSKRNYMEIQEANKIYNSIVLLEILINLDRVMGWAKM